MIGGDGTPGTPPAPPHLDNPFAAPPTDPFGPPPGHPATVAPPSDPFAAPPADPFPATPGHPATATPPTDPFGPPPGHPATAAPPTDPFGPPPGHPATVAPPSDPFGPPPATDPFAAAPDGGGFHGTAAGPVAPPPGDRFAPSPSRAGGRVLLLKIALVLVPLMMTVIAATAIHFTGRDGAGDGGATGGNAPTHATAVVTVDAGAALGKLNNPARYHNQAGPSSLLGESDLKLVDEIDPKLTRVFVTPRAYYNARTDVTDFNPRAPTGNTMYQYLDQVAAHSDRIMLNLDQCDRTMLELIGPNRCRVVLKRGLLHYKQRYPSMEFLEVFNEPDKDWETGAEEAAAQAADEYYRWYQTAYEIVKEVNDELHPQVPLRVGGPATSRFNEPYLRRFLDLYRADTNPNKRLDFVSYHQYQRRANPAAVAAEKPKVRGWLAERGLDPGTPVFVTEYGVFAGGNGGKFVNDDLLTQAAAMATLSYFYVTSGMDTPMNWVFNHSNNDRKSMFVDGVDGAVYPYYNVVAMQRKLGQTRVKATSDKLAKDGLGVNALATRDKDAVAVLVTNYQWQTGSTSHTVNVKVDHLPDRLAGRPVRVDLYLVDATTSNYTYDSGRDRLQRVDREVIEAGNGVSTEFTLRPNAIALALITPANKPS